MSLFGVYLAACLLLVAAGVAKAARPGDTATALGAALGGGRRMPPGAVRAGAALEAGVGLAALVRPSGVGAGLVGASYGGFAAWTAFVVVRGGALASCGCFGKADTPGTWLHVAVDLLFAAAAVAVGLSVGDETLPGLLGHQPLAGVPLLLGALVLAGAAYGVMSPLARLGALRRAPGGRP